MLSSYLLHCLKSSFHHALPTKGCALRLMISQTFLLKDRQSYHFFPLVGFNSWLSHNPLLSNNLPLTFSHHSIYLNPIHLYHYRTLPLINKFQTVPNNPALNISFPHIIVTLSLIFLLLTTVATTLVKVHLVTLHPKTSLLNIKCTLLPCKA